jgi:hypothetical protein
MMMSFVVPGKTRSTSANQRNAAGGILPPRTKGKFITAFSYALAMQDRSQSPLGVLD